jgi:hypothetical protein
MESNGSVAMFPRFSDTQRMDTSITNSLVTSSAGGSEEMASEDLSQNLSI